MRRSTYTEDFKKMVIEVYNTGKTIKEICEEYGVSTGTINNWTNSVQVKQKICYRNSKATEEKNKETFREVSKFKEENESFK